LSDPATLELAHERCRAIVQARAKNFAYAFVFLPEEKRRALDAVYAFCRVADDHADEETRAVDERRTRLEALRSRLHRALPREGERAPEPPPDPDEDLILLAVARAASRYHVKRDDLDLVIEGCIQDLSVTRYPTWSDLREYCFKVASAVGLACLEVFEYEGPAREPAIDLGLAMQLTNIVRDVVEDASRQRIYLPLEDLARFSVAERDLLAGTRTPAVRELLAFEARRARELFASAERLYALIPDRRARACPRTLASLYLALLDEIERRDFDVFTARATLRGTTKLRLAFSGIVRSLVG